MLAGRPGKGSLPETAHPSTILHQQESDSGCIASASLTHHLPCPPHGVFPALAAALLALSGCGGSGSGGTALVPGQDNACAVTSDNGLVTVGSGLPGDPAAPEPASGYRVGKTAVHAKQYMVTTANPYASRAGCEVLKKGGSAVDAAVAVQMVLGLVEPQSSGLGGGAFMLHYDAVQKKVQAYDGRETAPAAATANYLRWVSDTDRTAPQPGGARASGRSIGTPGAVRMLELAHRDHGRLAWGDLFQPAEQLARDGFPIGGRMAAAILRLRLRPGPRRGSRGLLLQCRWNTQGPGHGAEEHRLRRHAVRHRPQRRRCLLHGPDRPGHRREDPGHQRRLAGRRHHAGPDAAERPGGLPRQAPRSGLHHLPRLLGVRHVAPSSGGIAVASRARHPGELRSFATQAHGHRHRGRQAHGDGSASRERGGAPGLRRPRQVRGRYRLRPPARRLPRAHARQVVPARARRPDQHHPQHGHRHGGRFRHRRRGRAARGTRHHALHHRGQGRATPWS